MNTKTTGVFEAEDGETMKEATIAEGTAADFRMGGIGAEEPPVLDQDYEGNSSDDDGDDDESDGRSSVSKRKGNKKHEMEEEEALEVWGFEDCPVSRMPPKIKCFRPQQTNTKARAFFRTYTLNAVSIPIQNTNPSLLPGRGIARRGHDEHPQGPAED